MLRVVPSRSGTTAGGVSNRRAFTRRLQGGVVAVRSLRSHADPWIRFFFAFCGRMGPYETGLHSSSQDTPQSRTNNGPITAASANCLRRSHAHFPGAS